MGHRRYELSARYARGEAVQVAAVSTATYIPSTHKIAAIILYYDGGCFTACRVEWSAVPPRPNHVLYHRRRRLSIV